MVTYFSSTQSVYFNQFSAFSALNFFWFWTNRNHILKKYTTDAELAGQKHTLDVKLQSLCGIGFSLFAGHILAKPYDLGVNWTTTLCQNKNGVYTFFTLNFECHNRYSKLLLCNSENSDIAWWNKNHSECFFFIFFKEKTKSCFFFKKQVSVKNQENLVGWVFLKKIQIFLNLKTTVGVSVGVRLQV